MRRTSLLLLFLLSGAASLSAVEGLFQLNTVFQRSSYPMFGSGGKDIIRHTSAGISLKSTRGIGLQGVIDLTVLFPFKYQEKIYPASSFSSRSLAGSPVGMDAVVGMGYRFSLDPMIFLISGGFHTGILFDAGSYLLAFGLGFDGQAHVKLSGLLTAQVGLKFNLDFGGMQTFVAGSNQFAGFPTTFAVYTGIGLSY